MARPHGRGVATTHSKWGTDIAVLAGDYLFACGSSLGATVGGEVPLILASAISEVCEGQIVETTAVGDPGRSIEDYIEVISMKSAALFRTACELGAATSGASSEHRDQLVTYGESLGLAFQIVDAILDVVGDEALTGKTPEPIAPGVYTAPVLLACHAGCQAQGEAVRGRCRLGGHPPVAMVDRRHRRRLRHGRGVCREGDARHSRLFRRRTTARF